MRAGLAVLLVLACGAAAGALFVKLKLQDFGGLIQAHIEARTGAQIRAQAVDFHGLRGLRIDGFQAELETGNGVSIQAEVPSAHVQVDVLELLFGRLDVRRVHLEGARVRIHRPEGAPWLNDAGGGPADGGGLAGLPIPDAMRLTGNGCRIEVHGVAGDAGLLLDDLDFDLVRLAGARDLRGHVQGALHGDRAKRMQAHLRFAAPDDFDLQLQSSGLAASDVNAFAPGAEPLIREGLASGALRVTGYPGSQYLLSLHAPFENVSVRDQPPFIPPLTGRLSVLAAYDGANQRLTLNSASIEGKDIAGRVDGVIGFAGPSPALDLRLEADTLPVETLIAGAVREQLAEFGSAELALLDTYEVRIKVKGEAADPEIAIEVFSAAAEFAFAASDARLPSGKLDLGLARLVWRPGDGMPQGSLNITGGEIRHAEHGLHIQALSGILNFERDALAIEPLRGTVAGATFAGRGRYDIPANQLAFEAAGPLANLENTALADLIPDTDVAGAVNLRVTGTAAPERFNFDLALDVTQLEISHNWWLHKPAGIGASVKGLNIEILPGRAMSIAGVLEAGTSRATATAQLANDGGQWRLQSVRARSDHIDVVTLGQILRLPYTLTGGSGRNAEFEWTAAPGIPGGNITRLSGALDKVSAWPDGGLNPFEFEDTTLEVTWDNSKPDRSGHIRIETANAALPPFGDVWFLDLNQDPELRERFPDEPRDWTYDLKAEAVKAPPWEGTQFTGAAYSGDDGAGLHHFHAQVGAGELEGSYGVTRPDNVSTTSLRWRAVPAIYFIEHLEWPRVLSGMAYGSIDFTLDLDDPGTLEGAGAFRVEDGQFSSDYLLAQFDGQIISDVASIPHALRFNELRTGLELQGDIVRTPGLTLLADAWRMEAEGKFIVDGDLDYDLRLAINPETARQIPQIRDYFSVEGHRLTQNDIELAFRVTGPIFNPASAVTQLPPLGVTLVSGAFELTSEAIRVIDLPRQILIDLFKIGGGIVAQPRQGSAQP